MVEAKASQQLKTLGAKILPTISVRLEVSDVSGRIGSFMALLASSQLLIPWAQAGWGSGLSGSVKIPYRLVPMHFDHCYLVLADALVIRKRAEKELS